LAEEIEEEMKRQREAFQQQREIEEAEGVLRRKDGFESNEKRPDGLVNLKTVGKTYGGAQTKSHSEASVYESPELMRVALEFSEPCAILMGNPLTLAGLRNC
jgi:hypothetical protein